MPTSLPSFTGLVVSMKISTETTSSLADDEVLALEALVAQAYGVDINDITSIVEYIATGTLAVGIPDDVSSQDVIDELTVALATSLRIPTDSITLSLDPESGEISYSLTSPNFDETAALLDTLESDNIVDSLSEMMNLADVLRITTDDDIVAQVDVIVNGDNVIIPLQRAENMVDVLLDDQYDSHMEGNFQHFV